MKESTNTIRGIYFYLVAFIALGFIVGSTVYLLNYVAKVSVFQKGDFSFRGTPPGLFVGSAKVEESSPAFEVSCQDKCSLTETDRTGISDWQENYKAWREQPSAKTNRARGLVNAISFLIVALPLFILHFRSAQKEHRQASETTNSDMPNRGTKLLHSIYFYLIALAAVVMFIISAGATINTVLKTWVIKEANVKTSVSTSARVVNGNETSDVQGVNSLLKCADKCQISSGIVQELKNWQADYAQAKAETEDQTKYDWQRTLATSIPFLLVSIPLFWLHWLVIQKDRKKSVN
ncbi:hypothetical protein C4546_04040 [Candidatus Parcubacteria bacterium]|jgi:large-conductance mechanosensitive channel|nr:MAG: hypothetical protein C4546_04040 [Candidatus Parcubacteria bacterium]